MWQKLQEWQILTERTIQNRYLASKTIEIGSKEALISTFLLALEGKARGDMGAKLRAYTS